MSEIPAKRDRSSSMDSTSDNPPKKKEKQSNEYPLKTIRTQTIINNKIYGGIGGRGGDAIQQSTAGAGGVGNAPSLEYHFVAENVTMTRMDMEQEKAEIVNWLSPINFFRRQADISQTRQLGTGKWLLADPHFQEWKSSSGRTLWCHGIPGAGKTYLVYADLQVLVCWPHITPPSSFPNLHSLEIRASENDVRSYVDAQIQMSTDLSKHVQRRPDLREEIHSHISCVIDGMFLLAKLHMDSLSTKSTVRGVRDTLKVLSISLDASYKDIMEWIEQQHEEKKKDCIFDTHLGCKCQKTINN
ncbi:hypothetical protein B0H14DRAFT_1566647 [Mycena olivaceomarginata]|nr:hypothetical protein B0H14DRAFT_1566647 [Mycena olivaceomarginata]